MKVIVFEGMDCSGKSSMNKAIRMEATFHIAGPFHFPITDIREMMKRSNPRAALLREMLEFLEFKYRPDVRSAPAVFLDRCWPSTLVYQYLNPSMGKQDINLGVQILLDLMPVNGMVYMRPTYEVWKARINRRGDDWMKPEYDQWRRFQEAYDTVFSCEAWEAAGVPIVTIGTNEDGTPDTSAEEVINQLFGR